MSSYKETLDVLRREFEADLKEAEKSPTAEVIEALRLEWLGRKGRMAEQFLALKEASKEERPLFGKELNILNSLIEDKVTALKKEGKEFEVSALLARPPLDITLPAISHKASGALHPVTLVRQQMYEIFHRLGFSVFEGPELESEHYNFNALNIPDNHPSRDMQDTFFLKNGAKMVLRTQTSNVQIHAMLKEKPPLRFISPGKVYRVESDATHSPMFHQMECVVVDKGINFAHLKGVIETFMTEIFGADTKVRYRPSFFPFVEPGVEIDVYGKKGWLEIGGAGMIHPNVFEAVNYDSEVYTGYAFGFGLDRMAMLLYGLSDLRLLFEGSHSYHSQFPIIAKL